MWLLFANRECEMSESCPASKDVVSVALSFEQIQTGAQTALKTDGNKQVCNESWYF